MNQIKIKPHSSLIPVFQKNIKKTSTTIRYQNNNETLFFHTIELTLYFSQTYHSGNDARVILEYFCRVINRVAECKKKKFEYSSKNRVKKKILELLENYSSIITTRDQIYKQINKYLLEEPIIKLNFCNNKMKHFFATEIYIYVIKFSRAKELKFLLRSV